jgi:hypothetical protein
MYPVVTRAYETGSDQDTLDTNSANLIVGVGAGLIACAVLAFGLLALTQQGAGRRVQGFWATVWGLVWVHLWGLQCRQSAYLHRHSKERRRSITCSAGCPLPFLAWCSS